MPNPPHIKVYGIRHHGPGSARSIKVALKAQQPDAVLIELPQNVWQVLENVLEADMKPPVAILQYVLKQPEIASYLPFVEFSPEWQAIRWALKKKVPIYAMDLPFAWTWDDEDTISWSSRDEIRRDPLGYMAQLAGYEDRERWWEIYVEQSHPDANTFDAVLEMMTALRAATKGDESMETLRREAFMRNTIREALSEHHSNLAIVCGAWHAPVLAEYAQFSAASDKKYLAKAKKEKTGVTWVPWSYALMSQKEYGAGVSSPVWYEYLYKEGDQATIKWMAKASRVLRNEGFLSSSAHTLESLRMAETLAVMRGSALPGIAELFEAINAVAGNGQAVIAQLIMEKMLIGDKIGKTPRSVPSPPLLKDLEVQLKKARLTKEWASKEPLTKVFDLRVTANQEASFLLHRLVLLEVDWGQIRQATGRELGSFKETWRLKQKQLFELKLYSNARYGNTIEEAAQQRLLIAVNKPQQTLGQLVAWIQQAFEAGLTQILPSMLTQFKQAMIGTADTWQLLQALPTLLQIMQFGSVRTIDLDQLASLIDEMLPRCVLGLPNSVHQLDPAESTQWYRVLQQVHHGLVFSEDERWLEQWAQGCIIIAKQSQAAPLLQGWANRMAFEQQWMEAQEVGNYLSMALSSSVKPLDSAAWLEGFLTGSGALLLHYVALRQQIHDWLLSQPEAAFLTLLPSLRRAFSSFSRADRSALLTTLQDKAQEAPAVPLLYDEARMDMVLPTIDLLLG